MSDLERLARAMAAVEYDPAEYDAIWEMLVPHVRAVLQELRNPSEGMAEAGVTAPIPQAIGDPPIWLSVWQSMIDHILAQEKV